MINLLQYLLEVNIYLALAYGGYWLLLRRQTFYSANRAYLLASALLCLAIPLVQVNFAAPETAPVTQLPVQEVFVHNANTVSPTLQPQAIFTPFKAITALYITGATLGFVLLSAKLYRLLKLIFMSRKEKCNEYTLVCVPGTPSPFSFMSYVFVADEEQLQPVILKHELVHINQKHSYDVLFTEVLKIVCWFNPAVYLLQNSLKALHEFEADRLTAGKTEQDGYVDFLIAQACQNNGLEFANHFSEKNLLKSRIMKLYQKRSGNLARLNYLMALPLCAGMLCASSVAFSKNYGVKFEWSNMPAGITNHVIAKKDSVKKLRLKVTSGNTWGITDKLKLSGAGGKQLIYTAQTLTAQDKRELKQKFGIDVETTNSTGSMTNIMVLPPPPPVDKRNPNKVIRPIIPPPPPPAEKRTSAKSKSDIPPPPPPVEERSAQKDLKSNKLSGQQQGISTPAFSFVTLTKHVVKNINQITDAQKKNMTGSSLASFVVDEDQKISNITTKDGSNANLNTELVKAIAAYKDKITAKAGTYTLRLNFKLKYPDGTISNDEIIVDQEVATAGEISITNLGHKN